MGESKQKPLLTKKITKSRRTSANKHLEDNILRADETEAELSEALSHVCIRLTTQEPAAPPLIGSKGQNKGSGASESKSGLKPDSDALMLETLQ